MSQAIQVELLRFFKESFHVEQGADFSAEEDLIELGIIDSFGVVEMVGFLEEKFQIKLTEEDMTSPGFGTLNGLVRLIESKNS